MEAPLAPPYSFHASAGFIQVTSRFKTYIAAVVVAAAVVGALTLFWTGLWPDIGGYAGLGLWVAIVMFGASSSVRMPGGTVVDVSMAPLIAAAVLGGPTAAVFAAVFGV